MSRPFVHEFRAASPYINAHRGRTFVVVLSGETVSADGFPALAHDLALLSSLGVRLVLVYGIRPQIERRLAERGLHARYHRGLRITDDAALVVAKEAAGLVRVEIEALLSMGLATSTMGGQPLRVTSGNFVTARPLGVRDGLDYCHTGEVRRIDAAGIQAQLREQAVVLISPIGYSPTGEAFNLSAEEVATTLAIELHASKLLLLGEHPRLRDAAGAPVRQMSLAQAGQWLRDLDPETYGEGDDSYRHLASALHACRQGVARAHLLDRHEDGVLLAELFTREGVGTLISAEPYEHLRRANIEDVRGVLALIEPLERDGTLVRRPRERLEQEIDRFLVIERDGLVIACAALYPFAGTDAAELACLAVAGEYRNAGLGETLLEAIQREARALRVTRLFVLTTRTTHWFRERGFQTVTLDELPADRRDSYNYQRNSKILAKPLP